MYQTRSDAILRFPYGDTILLKGILGTDFTDSVLFKNANKNYRSLDSFVEGLLDFLDISAQIRNQYGDLLANLTLLGKSADVPDNSATDSVLFYLYTDELIPVGNYYMDIRVEVSSTEGHLNHIEYINYIELENIIVHSEIVQVEITQSVTHPMYLDTSGQDQRRV